MIRLRGARLTWSDADVMKMGALIGDDEASRQRVPFNAALLKLAQRKGLRLDKRAARTLAKAEALVTRARPLGASLTAKPSHPWEQSALQHQRSGLRFMEAMLAFEHSSFLVGDEVGVGKTLLAILWAKLIAVSPRTLVITRNIAKDQWADAIRQWIGKHERITIVDGTIKEQRKQAARSGAHWIIGHWESLAWAGAEYRAYPWGAIILDEAHEIGNRNTKRADAAHHLTAPHKIALTAHPFNGDDLSGLWSILRFLYPERYRSFWRFFHMHVAATPQPFGGFRASGAKRPKLLRWELAPFTLMRTRQQVFPNMPQITHTRRTLRLTPSGQREYERLRKQVFAELTAQGGGVKVLPIINEMVRLTRIRQYLVDPGLVGGSERALKYEAMLEILDDVDTPTVVFTSFEQATVRFRAYLQKRWKKHKRVDVISGAVKRTARMTAKKRFLAGDTHALLVVTSCGGEALNLGGFGVVAHLDLPFTVRSMEQTEGRVDRPEEGTGRLVPTTAYRLITKDSYEERLEARLEHKYSKFTEVFTVRDLEKLFR